MLIENIFSINKLIPDVIHKFNVVRWKFMNGDETLRLDYLLNADSVVFDVGGYKGDSSEKIYNKFKCNIYIFEPIGKYYQILKQRFKNNKKIRIFPFGLAAKTRRIDMYLSNDTTSAFGDGKLTEKVTLRGIKEVLEQLKIKQVDLMEINIEGGEFELLDYLLESNLVHRFKEIQVQFHSLLKNSAKRMETIQKGLQKTHKITYRYDFVWENWSRK